MKKSIVIFLLFSAFGFAKSVGQDTVRVKLLGKNIVTVVDGHGNNTKVDVGNNVVHVNSSKDDTVKIRVGRSAVIIRSGRHNPNIRLNHLDDREYELWTGKPPKFKGHWAGWEMGVNSFSNVDYTIINNGGFVEPVALNEHNLSNQKVMETLISIPSASELLHEWVTGG